MKQHCVLGPLVFSAALLATCAGAPPGSGDQDDDERAYQTVMARRSVRDNCLICHSAEIIETARLTPAQWKTEVEKMIGWGAPLPQEQQQSVIDYLAREYSDQRAPAPLARITYSEAAASVRGERAAPANRHGDPQRGAKLYAVNCANCHAPDGQGAELGPNLIERPVLVRPEDYLEVVRKGRGRMPGFQAVLKPEPEADILAWLKQRRYVSRPPK